MERAALRTGPKPDAEVFDLFVLISATAASLAGWEEPADDDEFLAIPVSLVGNCLRISPHAASATWSASLWFFIMFLEDKSSMQMMSLLHKLRRHLMDGVIPLVSNMLM